MCLLLKRLFDARYVEMKENHDNAIVGATRLQPDFLLITQPGRAFVNSLELQETDIYGSLEQEGGLGL